MLKEKEEEDEEEDGQLLGTKMKREREWDVLCYVYLVNQEKIKGRKKVKEEEISGMSKNGREMSFIGHKWV